MHLDFNLLKILKVNDYDCTITLNFEYGMKWAEPRLKISSNVTADKSIPLPQSLVKLLWQPDSIIEGLQNLKIHEHNNYDTMYLVNNTILYYVREMEVTVYCKMNFKNYPLDSHTCGLWILSKHPSDIFKYSLDILDYHSDYQVRLLEYHFKVHGDAMEISGELPFSTYNAGFVMYMDRKIQKYIINQYVPSGLLVMISWVSLLL